MATSVTAPALAALLGDGWRRPGEASSALADALRGLVVDGRLAARTRIPSERTLSAQLGVSRGSVSRAYARLREDGFLVSARGAGSWLTLPAGSVAAPALPVPDDGAERTLDLTIAALPAPDLLLTDAVARASAALPRHLAGHGYATAGLDDLRAAIAARLSARGLATSAEEVLVTAGAQHGARGAGPADRDGVGRRCLGRRGTRRVPTAGGHRRGLPQPDRPDDARGRPRGADADLRARRDRARYRRDLRRVAS
jgi:hypothetical protein